MIKRPTIEKLSELVGEVVDRARSHERERIVEWLREEHEGQAMALRSSRYHYRGAADDIEDCVHWCDHD